MTVFCLMVFSTAVESARTLSESVIVCLGGNLDVCSAVKVFE